MAGDFGEVLTLFYLGSRYLSNKLSADFMRRL